MGRPSEYAEGIAFVICERLSQGESLRKICSDDEMPGKSSVMRWLADNAAFRDQYARARESQADHYAEEILEIADEASRDTVTDEDGNVRQIAEVVNRSRLRVDTRKWLMARLAPKKYGDKITQDIKAEHSGAHEIIIRDIAAEKAERAKQKT
jgi:hypothetical protein